MISTATVICRARVDFNGDVGQPCRESAAVDATAETALGAAPVKAPNEPGRRIAPLGDVTAYEKGRPTLGHVTSAKVAGGWIIVDKYAINKIDKKKGTIITKDMM